MKRWLLVAIFCVGCDPSEPSLYVPAYDPRSDEPVSNTEFCALLARNTCAVLRPCCNALPAAFEEVKCRAASRALCEARRTKSMELGLVYDDFQAGRCVRGTAILLPNCRMPDDPVSADVIEACRNVWTGGKVVGEPCKFDNPVDCRPPALGVRVECRGECTIKQLLHGGESCETHPLDCESGLICPPIGTVPRVCTAKYHPLGAPCTSTATAESDACNAALDRFCDTKTLTCQPLPSTIGAECEPSHGCARPLRCDTDRTGKVVCTDGKPLGSSCNDDKECGSKICGGGSATLLRVCVPSGLGPPIIPRSSTGGLLDPHVEPVDYVNAIVAACSGVIPDGAGSLAPFDFPHEGR
jgi:hypothetical protein